jgi:hypothetical protein
MSTPQPPTARQPDAPTGKQLRYLRQLASQRGQTFRYPTTRRQASAEITRLKQTLARSHVAEFAEQRAFDHDPGPEDATRVREDEIAGYGANAHWTHRGRS